MTIGRPPNRFRQHILLPLIAMAVLGAANGPPLYNVVTDWAHQRKINSPEYKRAHGFWQIVELPKGQRLNAIHAAVLPTGRLLLIAGSGNDREQFKAGTFKTLVFDPNSGATTQVPTPTDLFCAGHAFLHQSQDLHGAAMASRSTWPNGFPTTRFAKTSYRSTTPTRF